jgi:hypothetical protein
MVEAMAWAGDGQRLSMVIAYSQFWSAGVAGLEAFQQMAEAAQSVLYVAKAPPTAPLRSNPLEDAALVRAAETTGGARVAYEGMFETLSRVLEGYRQSYIVTYVPDHVAPGGWHEIRVVTPSAGRYTVRTRKGYWGG